MKTNQGPRFDSGSPMVDPQGYLTKEQFEHLVSFADNQRDRMLLNMLFYTGRRVSEIVRSLTVDDLNFRDNMIHFTILKRRVPFKTWLNVNSNLMEMLKGYVDSLGLVGDDQVFPISRFRVNQIVKKIGKKAGLEFVGKRKIHPHIFRHSYAVMMSKKVKDIHELKKLQILLGHSNINMTAFYTEHFSPDGMKDFVDGDKNESE